MLNDKLQSLGRIKAANIKEQLIERCSYQNIRDFYLVKRLFSTALNDAATTVEYWVTAISWIVISNFNAWRFLKVFTKH